MRGQRLPRNARLERGHQALEHQRRLARSRDAGHGHHATLRHVNGERSHGVDLARLQMNAPQVKHGTALGAPPSANHALAREEGRYARSPVPLDLLNAPLADDGAALLARARTHLNEVVRVAQHPHVVVDHHDGVAVGEKVVHHAEKPLHVRRVKANRRLVEHVEHARRAIAHGTGKLHALSLAVGER